MIETIGYCILIVLAYFYVLMAGIYIGREYITLERFLVIMLNKLERKLRGDE